jgi:formylglycine-generating enzyme required for sulfatase activity
MIVLPTGRYMQGSAQDAAGSSPLEQPQHEVVIDYPFAVSANDVTVGDFREFVAATNRDMQGCDTYDGAWQHQSRAGWQDPGFSQTELHPVTCVSWNDAAAYALWLSAKTAHRYRLPSASEWEYAARAGGEAVRPWDSGDSGACANANVADRSAARRYPGWNVFACDDGYVHTAPVGSFRANTFGLNDMLGNVLQWTQDCWHDNYDGAPTDGSARSGGDCTKHELRGGSWFSYPSYVRASYRNHFAADYRASSVGFRLVREIPP